MTTAGPQVIITAGPNGAGTATFACEFPPQLAHCPVFINADLIAAGLSPFALDAAAIKAGRIMRAEIDGHVDHRRNVAFAATPSGRGDAAKISQWRAAGYRASLYFLRLPDADIAAERVRVRVAQGGQHMPAAVIRRRCEAGWAKFQSLYKSVFNDWFLYDNQYRQTTWLAQGLNQ